MRQHLIETRGSLDDPSIKRQIDRLLSTGWREVERHEPNAQGFSGVLFEREGDKSRSDDLRVQTDALQAEVERIEAGGDPDPEFFDKQDRMRA